VRGKDDGRNPVDAAIDAMGLGIELVPPESALFEQLASHVMTSDLHGLGLRLDEAFAVNVAGDAKKTGPEPSLLLYHGTRLVNMTKILRDGLLSKGHGSVQVGAMFGSGVYLANASSKSYNYCFSGDDGLLIACEARVGKMLERFAADPDATATAQASGYDSVRGVGRTTATACEKLAYGEAELPTAFEEEMEGSNLLYDEYVVPDEAVKIRYVLRVSKSRKREREE